MSRYLRGWVGLVLVTAAAMGGIIMFDGSTFRWVILLVDCVGVMGFSFWSVNS